MWLRVVGFSVSGLGLVVGPSLPHFYVRNFKQAWPTMIGRLLLGGASGGMFAAAFTKECEEEGDEESEGFYPDPCIDGGYLAGGIVTAVLTFALMAVDFATIGRATRRANLIRAEQSLELSVAPFVAPYGSSTLVGLSLTGRF